MKPLLFSHIRAEMASVIKVTSLILAIITIYYQDLTIIGNEAIRSELMSYILAIPFLLAYLLYRKRKMLRATIPFETTNPARKPTYTHEIVGALLCLTAFLLYWQGSYTFHPLEYHMLSLPLFTAGLVLIIFNTKTLKVLAFPIAFLLFLMPPPLEIVYAASTTLSAFSSDAAYHVLKAIGLPVSLATQYGTPVIILSKPEGLTLTFALDLACAGIYSIIGFTTFAVFVAYIARGPIWKKAIVFLAGIPLIYGLNIIRIVIIVLIGHQYGMETAMQTFHLFGGWALIFIGTFILLSLSEKIWKIQIFTKKSETTQCPKCNQSEEKNRNFCPACGKLLKHMRKKISKRDLGKIAIIIISAISIINLQVPIFALAQGPAEVTFQTPGGEHTITQILPEIPGYTAKFIYRDEKFEEIAQQDASLTYAYIPTNNSGTNIWTTIEIAKTRFSLHSWEVCLITWPLTHGYQPQVTQLSQRDIQLLENPPITARYFAFQDINTNLTQVILYWYENALFNTGSNIEQRHVKISLITFANIQEDVPHAEDQLLPFGKAIANHWQPIKTWSSIALIIAQHGKTLMIIMAALLVIILAFQTTRNQNQKKSNLKAYNKLALREEKLILQAVHQATKEGNATGNAIAATYNTLSEKPIKLSHLIEKLAEAENAGFVKKNLTNQNDDPVLVWKSQIAFSKQFYKRLE